MNPKDKDKTNEAGAAGAIALDAGRQKRSLDRSGQADQNQPRKKARYSCLACQARKTKCIGVETGTCQYCASIGAPCEISLKSRKRPFYQVSSEVFDYKTKLLRRFVSEEELPDLTVENIKAVLAKLDNGIPLAPVPNPPPRPQKQLDGFESLLVASRQQQQLLTESSTARANAKVSAPIDARATQEGDVAQHVPYMGTDESTEGEAAEPSGLQETMELDEHTLLQEEVGCMVLDSLQKYRYVGVDSSIRWNHAARMTLQSRPLIPTDPKIISPLATGLLPPTTPQSSTTQAPKPVYLPGRQLCMRYVKRFFEEIHAMYWFYPSEQFYAKLDRTLENGGAGESASWLCSLYSIFALGCMSESGVAQGRGMAVDSHSSTDYLALAKELMSRVVDEADVESVRAFGLLGVAMHGMCYSISAYLVLATAVRIGFSLGMHRDVSPKPSQAQAQQPHNDSAGIDGSDGDRSTTRHLWWTIYTLDYMVASRWGYPCAIDDRTSFMRYPSASPPHDAAASHSHDQPAAYAPFSVALARLRKRISHVCFSEPAHVGHRLPIRTVTDSLSRLKRWLDSTPAQLRWNASLAPQHRRSVAVLNLRYYISIITVTRPFLLFTVVRRDALLDPAGSSSAAKRRVYLELSGTCIEAAERSCAILQRMAEDDTFSSRTLFDVACIGEVIWVLILALQQRGAVGCGGAGAGWTTPGKKEEYRRMLLFCQEVLGSMERLGWCERIVPELEARIVESGVLDSRDEEAERAPDVEGGATGTAQGQMQAQGHAQSAHLGGHGEYMPHDQILGHATAGQQEAGMDVATAWDGAAAFQHFPGGFLDTMDFNFPGSSSEMDVYETLDFDTRSGLMDMFTDATLSTSNFYSFNPDGLNPSGQ